MINHPNLITIDFVQDRAGKLTRNAMHVKQARGNMLEMMVKHKITSLDDLKNIVFDDYCYNEKLSTATNYVFIKNLKLTYQKI